MWMILSVSSKLFEDTPQKKLKKFQKTIDKLKNLCYNKNVIKRDYKIKNERGKRIMKKAEEMRKITDKVNEQKRIERIAKHTKYANKIINGKVRLAALLGLGNCSVKIKRKFSPTLTKDALEKQGFEVAESRKNGRSIFKLKW